MAANQIKGNLFTHINLAFGAIDGSNKVVTIEGSDVSSTIPQLNALKAANPQLRTLFSIGGWSFGTAKFSSLASSSSSRSTFIASAISFCRLYGFDGIDIDWEFPGSNPDFTTLLKEFRAAIEAEQRGSKEKLLLTIAAPTGGEASALALSTIHNYLDWFNVMAYDYHGTWESRTGHNAPLHCNDGACTDDTISVYLNAGVPAAKLVLGMATYGHAFTLSSSSNNGVGAGANGAGTPGACTGEAGMLAYYEIEDFIASGATVNLDTTAACQYAYKGNQWVSYDSPATFATKVDYIKSKHLGGAMIWALDLDSPRGGFSSLQCVVTRGLFS